MNNDNTSNTLTYPDKPTSACEILQTLLRYPAEKRRQNVGGGVGLGISTSGNAITTFTPSDTITTYDKHVADLQRAKFACEIGLIVDPLSYKNNLTYTSKTNFFSHREERKKRDADEAEKYNNKWYRRMFNKS